MCKIFKFDNFVAILYRTSYLCIFVKIFCLAVQTFESLMKLWKVASNELELGDATRRKNVLRVREIILKSISAVCISTDIYIEIHKDHLFQSNVAYINFIHALISYNVIYIIKAVCKRRISREMIVFIWQWWQQIIVIGYKS